MLGTLTTDGSDRTETVESVDEIVDPSKMNASLLDHVDSDDEEVDDAKEYHARQRILSEREERNAQQWVRGGSSSPSASMRINGGAGGGHGQQDEMN